MAIALSSYFLPVKSLPEWHKRDILPDVPFVLSLPLPSAAPHTREGVHLNLCRLLHREQGNGLVLVQKCRKGSK